ncbi:MAG: SLATT domain-containing protein [Christensenellales bacterium]|jgi:hypothetical protein
MNNTIVELRKIRANATIEKKKHYNAAERKNKKLSKLQAVTIFISVANGSLLFFVLKQNTQVLVVVSMVLALVNSLILGLLKHFDLSSKYKENRRAGDTYNAIVRRIDMCIAHYEDKYIDDQTLWGQSNEIRNEYDLAISEYSFASTSSKDYQKAISGIDKGEENYSETDMKIGGTL